MVPRSLAIVFLAVLIPFSPVVARDPDRPPGAIRLGSSSVMVLDTEAAAFWRGLWRGSLRFKTGASAPGQSPGGTKASPENMGQAQQAASSPFELRILPERGLALVDLPAQSMFRFPVSSLTLTPERLRFRVDTGSARSSLRFEGFVVQGRHQTAGKNAPGSRVPRGVCTGAFAGGELSGTFMLEAAADEQRPDEERVAVEGFSGSIPGTLRLPSAAQEGMALVILVAASGTTDRDGNNYNIPGKNDAYRLIADDLAAQGIASFRYDKRGSGEAWPLVWDESFLRFGQYVDDAAEVMLHFRRDGRFSRIVVAGHAEGALVAAAAINREPQAVDAFVALCASPESPLQTVRAQLAGLPSHLKAEGDAILAALASGQEYPSPSEDFAGFFRLSYQPYLSSWFGFDPAREFPDLPVPVVFVQGGRDLQASEYDPDGLLAIRPSSTVFVLPTMNRLLKDVPADEDENYRSITDPSFPLGRGLVEVLSAIARLEPVPFWVPRFQVQGK